GRPSIDCVIDDGSGATVSGGPCHQRVVEWERIPTAVGLTIENALETASRPTLTLAGGVTSHALCGTRPASALWRPALSFCGAVSSTRLFASLHISSLIRTFASETAT